MKTTYKTICITAIGVMGLVPVMSYIHPVPDQSDLPNHVTINEFSPGITGELHKIVLPPVLFDATGTTTLAQLSIM